MTNHFDSKGGEQKKKRLRLCAVLALLLNCCQADGEKAIENERLSSLASAANAKGDYGTALKELEQSLVISREIGDKEGEAKTLNNIGHIHFIKVEKDKALSVFEQSLRIMQEIGDKSLEEGILWKIGNAYEHQGDLRTAEQYMSRAVQLMEEIGYPKQLQEEYREALEAIRAKIKGQVGGKHRAPFALHQRRRMERAGCLAKSQHARSGSPSLLGSSAPAGCPIVSQPAGL